MGLSVAIVGLPNVGKSTLFNALLKKQASFAEASAGQAGVGGLARVANFPFTTIEPNIGVVPVPDYRLERLADVIAGSSTLEIHPTGVPQAQHHPSGGGVLQVTKRPPIVPATCQFVDIAGLIAGASKGEGLGNKFLSHIRETSAICHVVRAFSDPDIIKQGVADPVTDLSVVQTELALADFQTLEKQPTYAKASAGKKDPNDVEIKQAIVFDKLRDALQKGSPAREVELSEEEAKFAKQLSLLTSKPILVVLNVDEGDLRNEIEIEKKFASEAGVRDDQVVAISAKVESELSELSDEEQAQYLKDLGVEKSGLERLIKKAFATLGLATFLTAGEKEVRAWTIKKGSNAVEASGEIHTDFMKKFIKADVVSFDDFVNPGGLASPKPGEGGWKNARENGKVRSEGRDYIMKDGEVVEFKIGS